MFFLGTHLSDDSYERTLLHLKKKPNIRISTAD